MTVQSAPSEPDAGTLYPSVIQDSNGNQIQIQYGAAQGNAANTCGRITSITDTRATGSNSSYVFTYTYLNGGDAFPHLTGVSNNISSGESYTLAYGSNLALTSPLHRRLSAPPRCCRRSPTAI